MLLGRKWPIPIPYRYFGIQILLTSNSNIILTASFHNAFASLFNTTEITMLLVGGPYGFKSIMYFVAVRSLFSFPLYIFVLFTGFFQRIHGLYNYICHVEMQLNDVIKVSVSIGHL